MADILEYLNTIENAVYGKDVRQAIVDSISQCYTDGKAGVNDLQARQLIEAVAAVNEEQAAALEVLQAKIEELEESEGGTQQSTTVDIPTVLVDGGVVENVSVNNNSTKTQHVTFTTEFTEIPRVMVAIGKNVGAVSQYGYLSANILYPSVTTTGFDFFLANRTGSDRSPGVVWFAYQPTVETIDLDITIPDAQGMTESQVREITGPISAAVDAIKTGYDGTVYETAAEAIRTQINDLHVLIGDEPGTVIDAGAIGYGGDSNVANELDGLNERLSDLEQSGGSGAGIPTEVRQAIYRLFNDGVFASSTGHAADISTLQSWATEVTDITISQSAISISGAGTSQLTATTSPAGGLVTWSSSNPAVATVSSTGLVTGVSNGTARIMASCGGKKATCDVTVSGFATLTGITATYTQSGTVYDTDSLSNLKSSLVVVASYDNSTTRTLSASEYTLSGTLSAGTSTITVSYEGQTDTFSVTVTHIDMPLYNWDLTASLTDTVENVTATTTATYTQGTGVVFDGTQKNINFGQVYGRDRTYEIDVASFGSPRSTAHRRLITFDTDVNTSSGGAGLTYRKGNGWYLYTGSAWDTQLTGTDGETLFNGKTVKLYLDADGMATVYYKTIGADDSTYVKLGESTAAFNDFTNGLVVSGGSNSDSLGEATISGLRIYEGEK